MKAGVAIRETEIIRQKRERFIRKSNIDLMEKMSKESSFGGDSMPCRIKIPESAKKRKV